MQRSVLKNTFGWISGPGHKVGLMDRGQRLAEWCDGEVDPENERNAIARMLEAEDEWAAQRYLEATGEIWRPDGAPRPERAKWMALNCARWAVNAFPQVVIGAKHLAALAATKLPSDVLAFARSPWSAWYVSLPPDVLFVTGAHGAPQSLKDLFVGWTLEKGWSIVAWTERGESSLMRLGFTSEQLCEEAVEGETKDGIFGGQATIDHETLDNRSLMLLGRVAVGIALELSSGQNLARKPQGPAPRWSKRKPGAPPIKSRIYELRADVKVDCRQAVADFVLGNRKSAPSVQHIVRGHWKLQPCGQARSERKPIWIQPYWRGPDGAPIAVRSHVIAVNDAGAGH